MNELEKERIYKYAKRFDIMICKGIIKNYEIEELFAIDINEMININISKDDSLKKKTLFYLYFNPYILYFCQNLSNNVLEQLPFFIQYRYEAEIYELNSKLSLGEISEENYNQEINHLKSFYYFYCPFVKSVDWKHLKRT